MLVEKMSDKTFRVSSTKVIMTTPNALEYGLTYHIYNRGNNREALFRNPRNYHYFMELYAKHIYPIADTFVYSLLPNHFHFCVQIKTEHEIQEIAKKQKVSTPSQSFGNLFNAYAKTINLAYSRTGSLFEKPFHRKIVTTNTYFRQLVLYIHHNPQKHGIIDDFRLWTFSSYTAFLSNEPTRLKRDMVLDLFGSIADFEQAHQEYEADKLDDEFDA